MLIFYVLSFMIVTIIIANFLSQAIPSIPKAFWQILGGIILALVPALHNFTPQLDPSWFMMLIIAPLLFYEGQKTSARIISRNFGAIVGLAGGVAIMTVLLLTLLGSHALAWSMPLMLALAAIVTPTDATALESVTEGRAVPSGIKRALSLESLFNDATGLVVLELALIWLNTGKFSFVTGFIEFMKVAFGGAIVGLLAGFILMMLRQYLLRNQFDDTVAHTMLYFLAPIFIYGLTEHLGLSGIIAVVVTGVFSNEERHHTQFMSSVLSNLTNQLTGIVSEVLNGLVFVLLGSALVQVIKDGTGHDSQWLYYIGIGIAIYLVMLVFRFIVIYRSNDGPISNFIDDKGRDGWVFALGGVHGTVTMAMAFSLPLTLDNGAPFPQRNALLLIAATVILLSLIVPLIIFPKMLDKVEPKFGVDEYSKAHLAMINTGMAFVDSLDISSSVKQRVIGQLQDQLGYGSDQLDREEWIKATKEVTTVIDKAMEEAIDSGAVSENLMIFYRRLKASQDRKWAFGKKNFFIWLQILFNMVKRLVRNPKKMKQREYKRRQEHLERYSKRLDAQMSRLAELPAPVQAEVKKSVEQQKAWLDAQLQLAPQDYSVSKKNARQDIFNEMAVISDSALTEYVNQLEMEGADQRHIIAVRHVIASSRGRWERQESADVEESEVLLAALQAELTYIQNGRLKNEFNPALLKELYDEVIAAQALLLSADIED
ncbi:antiporter [Weissella oryzae SG25]|uniref:Antiporter n=1 Tax=Weissella oryzae (strain DSM 25784 / JCM 18191 / LMG 30913 / SG25) TaxID=1329250 RepID=A0A069CX78_WEIOS|nr:sodium:proton antiporter [Weissella oryzae]GAK31783.1 antiporter [Weissella oryzae SG25]